MSFEWKRNGLDWLVMGPVQDRIRPANAWALKSAFLKSAFFQSNFFFLRSSLIKNIGSGRWGHCVVAGTSHFRISLSEKSGTLLDKVGWANSIYDNNMLL